MKVIPIITGTTLGALGGYLVAPEDKKISGAISGGIGVGISSPFASLQKKLLQSVELKRKLARISTAGAQDALRNAPEYGIKDSLKDVASITGITAAANKIMGAYDKDKKTNQAVNVAANFSDDAALLAYRLSKLR